jgi:hypothetical protein
MPLLPPRQGAVRQLECRSSGEPPGSEKAIAARMDQQTQAHAHWFVSHLHLDNGDMADRLSFC